MVQLGESFYSKLNSISQDLGMNPRDLLLVMFFESAGLNPAAVNPHGNAQGLIQFMPSTLKGMGADADEVKNFGQKPAEEQLDWVKKYIEGKSQIMHGEPFKSAAQYYHANFFPATLYRWHGSDPYANRGVVIVSKFSKDPRQRAAYAENKILDTNDDGYITVADIIRTLSKTAKNPGFQKALARLNQTAGSGQVSDFSGKFTGKKTPSEEDSTTQLPPNQLAQSTDQDPPKGGIVDVFLNKLNDFVGKIADASHKTHLLTIKSQSDLASKVEYARVLAITLKEKLDMKSEVRTNGDNVDLEIKSDYGDKDSERAILEVSKAVANAFTDATKKFASIKMDSNLILNAKSVLPELDAQTAERYYRMFNLKIIKGR
jgi:hypothetical protein